MENALERIQHCLNSQNITYEMHEHEPVRTSEEAAAVRGVSMAHAAKAMIAKTKTRFILLVLPGDCTIDWKRAKQAIGVKDLQLASQEEAEKRVGVEMGGMAPLGNVFDLPTYFDERITKIDTVHFNAGSKSHTISMKGKDLIAVVQPTIISFAKSKESEMIQMQIQEDTN